MKKVKRFYRMLEREFEYCFNIETTEPLTAEEMKIITWLLTETFPPSNILAVNSGINFFAGNGRTVVEIGPRLNVATPWNTNALSILRACGITKVTRIERSRRYLVLANDVQRFAGANHDRMTEMVYPQPLATFETGIVPEAVYTIPLMEEGSEALRRFCKKMGLAMDEHDIALYCDYFVSKLRRNPTNVELFDLGNANSEHSRHGFFRGEQVIDGVEMPETLMEIVKSTLEANPGNSVIAFKDNSSAIKGYEVQIIAPLYPGKASAFGEKRVTYHILFTAETHNFPSGIAPFPGAETGTGGRIRDVQATGRGGLVVAGTAGYCVGNLLIPGYEQPWEERDFVYPKTMASPLQIEIEASNGASDYGNKFGEPVIQGFTRSFGLRLPGGERREWLKPIMFTGGVGQIADSHLEKGKAEKGMIIAQVGGPAYRIGMGGGAASSMLQGENKEGLDFNAVQRGDAEMEQKMNRVIRACVEMSADNPLVSIHDQGAGGPANVLKELVGEAGGRVELSKISLGDPTLSALEIWVAEFQERNGLLIRFERLEEFMAICEREKVACEVLGEVTGDGIFTVHDERDDSTPVNLHLADVLGKIPQKTFTNTRRIRTLGPLTLPEGLTAREALKRVLRLVSVGSKRFLVNKVDRSVTGLIARQQCCGSLQLPVSDVAVIAQSHFGLTGAAIAIGEQPIKGLLNPKAMARMSVAEMLTNILWAGGIRLEDIRCSANWMGAPKLDGEGADLYDAAVAMRDLMVKLGIAVDGGKDSLSMATRVPLPDGSTETVKSPLELVVSGYVNMPDITKVVTPDLKRPGESNLIYVDLAKSKRRLGGSALAQVYGQIGDECPDVEDAELLKRAFNAIQKMIDKGLILAGHDISDGGLIVTLLEMVFAGNCGLFAATEKVGKEPLAALFAEEAGMIIECWPDNEKEILRSFSRENIPAFVIGNTTVGKSIVIRHDTKHLLNESMTDLRSLWEETSYRLERLQCNPDCAEEERESIFDRPGPQYFLSFTPQPTPDEWLTMATKPRVAVIRDEGSNGDREMASAFYMAGFEPWDVTMTDLLSGKVTLDQFRGIVFVGGFSYADVFDSAKGWAGVIRFNPKLKEMFDRFYNRPDTFSLGVCNGCQLMALLGWVPFKGLSDEAQPRFIRNRSGRFESRWSTVEILPSPAIMLAGMGASRMGVWVAHGEGKFHLPRKSVLVDIIDKGLAPVRFIDDYGDYTEYPFNPNGSPGGITGLCSPDGRHLAMMPHPERAFLKWQWPWMPEDWKEELEASPWLRMFQNAREWCKNT